MHKSNHKVWPKGMQTDTIAVQTNTDNKIIRTTGPSQMQENTNKTSALVGMA